MTKEWQCALDAGKLVHALFLDVLKAFFLLDLAFLNSSPLGFDDLLLKCKTSYLAGSSICINAERSIFFFAGEFLWYAVGIRRLSTSLCTERRWPSAGPSLVSVSSCDMFANESLLCTANCTAPAQRPSYASPSLLPSAGRCNRRVRSLTHFLQLGKVVAYDHQSLLSSLLSLSLSPSLSLSIYLSISISISLPFSLPLSLSFSLSHTDSLSLSLSLPPSLSLSLSLSLPLIAKRWCSWAYVTCIRHLGQLLSSTLTWSSHVEFVLSWVCWKGCSLASFFVALCPRTHFLFHTLDFSGHV